MPYSPAQSGQRMHAAGAANQATEVTTQMRPRANCPGPVGLTRRNMLQIGAIGALNLTPPRVLAAGERRSRDGAATAADSCILVFLNGGPSHLDMWDMKPELPKEMRSEFQPVATTVPGIRVCEHLPRLARLMDRCTLVRSVHHKEVRSEERRVGKECRARGGRVHGMCR